MCGIAGMVVAHGSEHPERLGGLVDAMTGPLVNRGPDGSGRWVDAASGVALAHTRLAIIDLSPAGDQPMVSADGRWVVCANAEVYNHRELGRRLAGEGTQFRGHSDIEVLVEAVAHWGVATALERIDGMFGLALWDRRERQLTLARDRLGEKPLCWAELPKGGLIFGSTVDAVLTHPDITATIDRDALAGFLRHKDVPDPATIVRGVHKLEPAHLLRFGHGSTPVVSRYWALGPAGVAIESGAPPVSNDEMTRLLADSVEQRLVADVPVGVFLSGGVDSTTVAALATRVSATPVRTFTIAFGDADLDESHRAAAVAAHLGTDHRVLMASEEQALGLVDRLATAYDEPFGDSSALPTMLLAQLARQEVTVALTGDGGDELFGGYNRYTTLPALWGRASRVPGGIRHPVARLIDGVPPAVWDRLGAHRPMRGRVSQLAVKAAKVGLVAGSNDTSDAYQRVVSHWQDPASLVLGVDDYGPETPLGQGRDWSAPGAFAEAMIDRDLVTYLPHDVLTKVDRATMAFGLESRAPLLARPVVEAAVALPIEQKIRDGRGKWMLRQVLGELVPPALWESPKQGFGPPLDAWVRGALADWCADHIFGATSRSMLDQEVLRRAWDDHRRGRRNHGYALWDVAAFGAWATARDITG